MEDSTTGMLEFIAEFTADNEWEDKIPQQVKAFFTTWCFLYRVDADTSVCDNALRMIYEKIDTKSEMSQETFENFMLELVV